MEDSPIGLDKWMVAFWMLANCKNGVSSYELHRALKVRQQTAWFMLHRIREAMRDESVAKFGGTGGAVEADETFVGPNPYKMHKSRKLKLQRFAASSAVETFTLARLLLPEYLTARLAKSALR